jgi:hypothetical protein
VGRFLFLADFRLKQFYFLVMRVFIGITFVGGGEALRGLTR